LHLTHRDLRALIAALSKPAAYPRPAAVLVRQTHMSVVFLAGEAVFKIHKPVNLGFVDFTSLEKRKRDCDEEVRPTAAWRPPSTAASCRSPSTRQSNAPGSPGG
jgi:aminoglycoside phosphotransferase family enzyme